MKEKVMALGKFLKKNVYYVLLIACVLAVGTMITLTVTENNQDNTVIEAPDNDQNNQSPDENPNEEPVENPDEPGQDVITNPVTFISPVQGQVVNAYSIDELVYCTTLKQWQTHSGMDYSCEAGASVVAVYDGTVYKVEYNLLDGNVVTIDHGNGLMSKYGSLDSVSVKEGDKLLKGDELGKAGNSAIGEVNLGTHLHFETLLDGVHVNPAQYSEENK